ncbi:MAG TPA: hypothetical protein VF748_08575 [Candidatus Acidoferrum sp.]
MTTRTPPLPALRQNCVSQRRLEKKRITSGPRRSAEIVSDSDGIFRKLLRKKGTELLAKFFARQWPGSTLEFPAHKFQPVGFGAPEPLDGQDQPLLGVIGNSQHPPCEARSESVARFTRL